jgi:hypothetical protein
MGAVFENLRSVGDGERSIRSLSSGDKLLSKSRQTSAVWPAAVVRRYLTRPLASSVTVSHDMVGQEACEETKVVEH